MADATPGALLDFGAPPVIEVALSTEFRLLPQFDLVAIVDAWRELYRDGFPQVQEQGRYEPPPVMAGPGQAIRMLTQLPTPRLWFLDEPGTQLIQLQNNWFGRNWRKVDGDEEYPRYPALRDAFRHDLERLLDFLDRRGLGQFEPGVAEVTYINHVVLGPDLRPGDVLRAFAPDHNGYPSALEAANLAARLPIVHDDDRVGVLTVNASTATRAEDSADLLSLQVTARGPAIGSGVDGVLAFLDIGRDWVVRCFGSITTDTMHRRWGRTR